MNDTDLVNTLIRLNKVRDLDKIYEIIDEFLKEKIKGVGCSILLLDPTTNELKLVYSKSIEKPKWGNATYQIGEGFTGWVAKYKKFLYIKDETDKMAIDAIYPEPPIHAGISRGKPCETTKIGPFMAAPILHKGTLLICRDDLKDTRKFTERLRDANDPLSLSIKENLRDKTRNDLNNDFECFLKDLFIKDLIQDINNLIQTKYLYSESHFSNVELSSELKKFVTKKPIDKEDITFINRLLLENIYQSEIAKRYILGVVRLPAVKGGKRDFTNAEKELFKNFAVRLSQSVENANIAKKFDNLISIYGKIGSYSELHAVEDPFKKLLNDLIKYIPEIVGGGYCTIFLINDDNDKLSPKATTSISKEFIEYIANGFFYNKNGPGLTPWVARTSQSLKIDDISDINEIKKKDGSLIAIRDTVEITIDDVGPFLAVPILNEGVLVGVIRVLRHRGARPFESIDEKLLKGFADLLSIVILNIKRKLEIEKSRNRILMNCFNQFSNVLINKGKSLSKVSYKDEIQRFLVFNECEGDISEEIVKSLENLWQANFGMDNSIPLLKDFKYYENVLFELPGYRDHFIHQYQVFVLGAIIMDELYRVGKENNKKDFYDYYVESVRNKSITEKDIDIAWLITSSFHDIAYPIEKSDKIFNKFFNRFMGIDKPIIEGINLQPILSQSNYIRLIDNLADFYVSLQKSNREWEYKGKMHRTIDIDDRFSIGLWKNLFEKKDHGILGALILLHQSNVGTKGFSTVIYPSALAIALHNKLLYDLHEDILFEKNPLSFLLRYCDLVQEWGRIEKGSPEFPTLLNIDIRYNSEDDRIHVKTEIRLGDLQEADNKEQEAVNVFDHLKSSDIVFEFVINDKGTEFKCSQ